MPHNWKSGEITILIGTGSRHLVPKRVVAGIRLPDDPPMPTLRGRHRSFLALAAYTPFSSHRPASVVLLGVLPEAGAGVTIFSMVTKRSVSLVDEVATAVEEAAKQDGVSFSAWLSNAAEKQLQVRQGLRGVAAWEGETGSLSAEELAAGEALLARLRSGVSGVASRVRRR
jgi:hypothetical protein